MNIEQFEELLKKQLAGLPEYEINELTAHYRELYNDAIEQGVDDFLAVKNLGNPITIAKNHRNQRIEWTGINNITKQSFDKRPLLFVVLAVLAFPLLIALCGFIFSLSTFVVVMLFVGFVIGFAGLAAAVLAGFGLSLGGLYCLCSGIATMSQNSTVGMTTVGIGLVAIGLSIVCLLFVKPLTRSGVRYSKWFFNFIRKKMQGFFNWVKMMFVGQKNIKVVQ